MNACMASPIQLIPQERSYPTSLESQIIKYHDTFWEGTSPSFIQAYLPQLPKHLISPTLRTLRARVLNELYRPLLHNFSFKKILLSLLKEIGYLEKARELLLDIQTPEIDELLLELQWLEGEQKKACEKITNLMRVFPSISVKEQNIYCLYLNGEYERAKIANELLSELDSKTSSVMQAFFEPSSQPKLDTFITSSPFLLTLWCALGKDIPTEKLNTLAPSSLALIVRSASAPIKARLLAAETALQEGIISSDTFTSLLNQAPSEYFFSEVARELRPLNPEKMALLFKKAADEKRLGLIGYIYKQPLSQIELSPTTLILAPHMIRTFLEAGEKDLAQKWGDYFIREAPKEAISLLPLLYLAFPQCTGDGHFTTAWHAYMRETLPGKAPAYPSMIKDILEVLEENPSSVLPAEPMTHSRQQDHNPFDQHNLALLKSASENQRKGETLLLILIAIGENHLSDLSINKFIPLLRALNQVGYTAEARSLALEFALAKGI